MAFFSFKLKEQINVNKYIYVFFVVGKLHFSASIPLTCVTASRLFQSGWGEVAPDHHKLYAAQVELSIKVPCSLLTTDKFLTWARLGGGTPISWEEWLTDGEAVGTQESQPAEQDVWALPFLVPSSPVSFTLIQRSTACQSISFFAPPSTHIWFCLKWTRVFLLFAMPHQNIFT